MEQEANNTINKKIVGAGIIILILLFVAGIFLLDFVRKPKTALVPTQSSIVVPTDRTTVTLTSNGFTPKTITVKPKTQVIWTNSSGADATVNSADHPTHQVYPPLNLGLFSPGSNVSLVFDMPGTYNYHDHFHPERTGTIVVQ